jgi:hypothetical protein
MATHRTEFDVEVLTDFEHYADRLFTGYREFAIGPLTENKVRVTRVEDLQGWIAPVFEALMGRAVQRHHHTFNESLKRRAEAMAAQAATGG